MDYLPYDDRSPDSQYRDLLQRILDQGETSPTRQGPPALTLMQQTMRFDLANGFPLITDRNMGGFWRKPIGELCAFINGATTLDELAEFGCDWWGPWATAEKSARIGVPTGDIGPGSYGGAFHDFPCPPARANSHKDGLFGFDQFAHLVEQIREHPEMRTHVVTPWIPFWNARGTGKTPLTTISPCHGWVFVRVLAGRLHLHMVQRSGDVPVGVPSNMVQYAALTLILEHLTGYAAGVYYHTINDAHVYADQVDKIQPLLEREPRRLPTVQLTDAGRAVNSIHDFRAEHFELADYDPHPSITGIPVGV